MDKLNKMEVILAYYRYGRKYHKNFESMEQVLSFIYRELEHGNLYPVKIVVDGQQVWAQEGPFNLRESLDGYLKSITKTNKELKDG